MRTLYIHANGEAHGLEFFTDRDGFAAARKDPSAVLDYTFDWSRRLDGDTITTSAFSSTGAAIDAQSNTTTTAAVTLSGDPGPVSDIVNTITTGGGRTEQKTLRLYGAEQ